MTKNQSSANCGLYCRQHLGNAGWWGTLNRDTFFDRKKGNETQGWQQSCSETALIVIPAQAGIQRDGLRVARLDSGLRRNDGYFVQSKKEYALARAVSEGGTPPELAGRWGVVGAENGADGW